MSRKQINPKKRFQILNRDNFTCQYCWLKAWQWVQLQIDHKIPVSKGWDNSLNNLITSCFECNIWKWSEDKQELKELLYKTKISDNVRNHIKYFLEFWNYKNFWTVDNNTMALLKILFAKELWGNKYCTILDMPYFFKNWKHYTWNMKLLDEDFKEWWVFCDEILNNLESPFGHYLKSSFEDLDYVDEELEDDEIWHNNCKDDMNNRLNYRITEMLSDLYIDWELKNNYSIKKFSYFYNQIKNG